MDRLDLKRNKLDQAGFLLLILLSIFLCTLLCPFSPVYRYCFQADESTYHIVSLGLLKGRLPYRDLFDHKGPLTYVIYALGLLLSGEAPWGIWVLMTILNSLIFLLIYTNLRLLFSSEQALTGTCALLVFLFLKRDPIYATGSKPDHLVLLLLLVSEYIFLRGIREKKDNKCFTFSDMFLLGLCAGGIFMIKYNALIYFLCFLGAYFLFLLIRKAPALFFRSVFSFLGGLASAVLPFFLFFAVRGALPDLMKAYFSFNLHYAGTGGLRLHFSRFWFDSGNNATVLILFIVTFVAGLLLLIRKKYSLQYVICFLLGLITYFFLTLPTVFPYSFTTIIPLYLLGFGYLSQEVQVLVKMKTACIFSAIVLLLAAVSLTVQLALDPPQAVRRTELKKQIDAYYASHPDADCMFLTTMSNELFFGKELPECRYFYLPREETEEMYFTQYAYIREGKPELVAIYCTVDMTEEWLAGLHEFFEKNGYSLYYDDRDDSRYLAYVRKE